MVIEIHDMTVQLQASLEDCLEMAEENRADASDETGDGKNYSCPNIGVCFLDLAEVMPTATVGLKYIAEIFL